MLMILPSVLRIDSKPQIVWCWLHWLHLGLLSLAVPLFLRYMQAVRGSHVQHVRVASRRGISECSHASLNLQTNTGMSLCQDCQGFTKSDHQYALLLLLPAPPPKYHTLPPPSR